MFCNLAWQRNIVAGQQTKHEVDWADFTEGMEWQPVLPIPLWNRTFYRPGSSRTFCTSCARAKPLGFACYHRDIVSLSAKVGRRVELDITEGWCQTQPWPEFRKNIVQLMSFFWSKTRLTKSDILGFFLPVQVWCGGEKLLRKREGKEREGARGRYFLLPLHWPLPI